MSRKNRSTIFIHELEIGVKGTWKRGCFVLVCRIIIRNQMQLEVFGDLLVDFLEETKPLLRCRGSMLLISLPCR